MAEPAATPRSPLTFEDLTADLIWPRLWKAGRLALRPARIGLGTFFLIGVALLLAVGDWLDQADTNVLLDHGRRSYLSGRSALDSGFSLSGDGVAGELMHAFILTPVGALREAPLATLLIGPLLLAWAVLLGGAISRTAATEFASARTVPWPSALGLALTRFRSLVGAILLPLLIVWLVGLGLAAAGWALFSVGFLGVAGGLLWFVFLAAALAAAAVMVAFTLGHSLLVPAVVCEGADTIDAVQHAFSMVFARPLRLLIYAALLIAQGLLLGLAVSVVVVLTVSLARTCAGVWLDENHRAMVEAAGPFQAQGAAVPAEGAPWVAARLVYITTVVFGLIGGGVMVSYFWCAGTTLFLAMRRACDGQEMSELWWPGMVDGTTSESLIGREGEGGGAGRKGPGAARPGADAIIDDGPADEG